MVGSCRPPYVRRLRQSPNQATQRTARNSRTGNNGGMVRCSMAGAARDKARRTRAREGTVHGNRVMNVARGTVNGARFKCAGPRCKHERVAGVVCSENGVGSQRNRHWHVEVIEMVEVRRLREGSNRRTRGSSRPARSASPQPGDRGCSGRG